MKLAAVASCRLTSPLNTLSLEPVDQLLAVAVVAGAAGVRLDDELVAGRGRAA